MKRIFLMNKKKDRADVDLAAGVTADQGIDWVREWGWNVSSFSFERKNNIKLFVQREAFMCFFFFNGLEESSCDNSQAPSIDETGRDKGDRPLQTWWDGPLCRALFSYIGVTLQFSFFHQDDSSQKFWSNWIWTINPAFSLFSLLTQYHGKSKL